MRHIDSRFTLLHFPHIQNVVWDDNFRNIHRNKNTKLKIFLTQFRYGTVISCFSMYLLYMHTLVVVTCLNK